jgi:hypothetical protein
MSRLIAVLLLAILMGGCLAADAPAKPEPEPEKPADAPTAEELRDEGWTHCAAKRWTDALKCWRKANELKADSAPQQIGADATPPENTIVVETPKHQPARLIDVWTRRERAKPKPQ